MSAMQVRKNNVGRAIVRFLIGAIIIAAVVIVLNEVVLKKPDTQILAEASPRPTTELVVPTDQPDPEILQPENSDSNVGLPSETPGIDQQPESGEGQTGEDSETNNENGELIDEFGSEPTAAPEETAEPVVTPDPVPDPEPTPTPVPASLYAQLSAAAKKDNWKLDKATRIKNGITVFETGTSENGGSVISMTGWSIGNLEGFNAKTNNTCYVYVTNEKGDRQFYTTTKAAGATGIKHTLKNGHNLDYADFTCVIDLTNYPNGIYSLGTANYFIIEMSGKKNKYHFGYTLGDAYVFTVSGGNLFSVGGVTLEPIEDNSAFSESGRVYVFAGSYARKLPQFDAEQAAFIAEGRTFQYVEFVDNWYKIRLDDGSYAYVFSSRCELLS